MNERNQQDLTPNEKVILELFDKIVTTFLDSFLKDMQRKEIQDIFLKDADHLINFSVKTIVATSCGVLEFLTAVTNVGTEDLMQFYMQTVLHRMSKEVIETINKDVNEKLVRH